MQSSRGCARITEFKARLSHIIKPEIDERRERKRGGEKGEEKGGGKGEKEEGRGEEVGTENSLA